MPKEEEEFYKLLPANKADQGQASDLINGSNFSNDIRAYFNYLKSDRHLKHIDATFERQQPCPWQASIFWGIVMNKQPDLAAWENSWCLHTVYPF